jgi:hypothetical protein
MQVAAFQQTIAQRSMRATGLLAAGVQLLLAVALGAIASGPFDFPNPPEVVPRGLAIGVLYAVPAVIGALGAIAGRRALLVAAALASTVGSVVAFSGVTLIFLVPGLLLVAAAGAVGSVPSTRRRPFWRLVLFAVLAAPVVTFAVLRLGIFVVPGIVLLVLILQVARGTSKASLGDWLAGLLVVGVIGGLVIGSGWALFSMTETRCWTAYRTPVGIEYRTVPEADTGEIQLGGDEIAGGCDSGELTPRGAGVAALLALGAIGLAALASRSRPPRPPAPDASAEPETVAQ